MSAFVVSKAHIDYLIESGLRLGFMDRSPLRWNDPAAVPKWVEGGENANYLDRWRDASRVLDESTADRVGRMLLAENVRSVRYRYPDDRVEDLPGVIAEVAHAEEPDWYVFTRHDWNRPRLDPVQTLKALRCYEYQTCETPDWEETEAWEFCDALKTAAIAALPGYEAADWEITVPAGVPA